MDIANLESNHIEYLAGAYKHASLVFNVEPIDASEKQKRKIHKSNKRQRYCATKNRKP